MLRNTKKNKSSATRFATATLISLAFVSGAGAQLPFPLTSSDEASSILACSSVDALELPELLSIAAQWNAVGQASNFPASVAQDERSDLPAHCRVAGVIAGNVGFEVWLPAPDVWNGRFLAVGNTDTGGDFSYVEMTAALNAGYATASTDTGHRAGEFAWLGDDARLRNFAYRAVYEMTAKARVIVTEFYSRPADYRYFNGCALGGRQGLMEAQRFPEDYDGVVAGAPDNAFVATRVAELWAIRASRPSAFGVSLLETSDLATISAAVRSQCDTMDGVADETLEDPRRCNFDPGRLQCGFSTTSRCLTPAQVGAVRDIYRGPPDDPGARPAGLSIGSETSWSFVASAEPSRFTLEFFRRAIFDDPTWNWRNFDFASDAIAAREVAGWMLDANSPDIARFRDGGGKLLLYHGWNDSISSAQGTIAYYEAVEASLALAPNPSGIATADFARLFLVPGMQQCGVVGPDGWDFDAQRAIEDWVERGITPVRIEAAEINDGQSVRTRPLCPYPQTARYRGSGNTERSGSYICAE